MHATATSHESATERRPRVITSHIRHVYVTPGALEAVTRHSRPRGCTRLTSRVRRLGDGLVVSLLQRVRQK